MRKRTKIVCTLGPSTATEEIIHDLVNAGMNAARLNFSHGTHEEHAAMIKHVRAAEEKTKESIPIIQDLQGPKIRIGLMPKDGVELTHGAMVTFDTGASEYHEGVVPVDYADLHRFVKPGERLFINDGRIETRIVRVDGTRMSAEVVVGGKVISHKGINVPDSTLDVRAMTEKDKKDLEFGVANDVDIVALSFVTKPEDILDARYLIDRYQKEQRKKPEQPIALIAKIERREAVLRIGEILQAADGIMIARGDLGVEMPSAEVPLIQKRLIDLALAAGKPVIVATQMLDSMQENPRATRAEVSDVANAVIDHTDAVMLSNETATGKYPVDAVRMMTNIIRETERSVYDNLPLEKTKNKKQPQRVDDIMSELSRVLAEEVHARLILSASLTGETGRLLSRHRPELPILVGTSNLRTERQLNISWGVLPFRLLPCSSIEELIERAFIHLRRERQVRPGDRVVVVAGEPVGSAGHVNLLEVREVS